MTVTRSRPSAALVVAITALTVALVGTAVAGPGALMPKKAVSKSQVKTIAKKQIAKAAPGLAVKHADTADSAKTAEAAVAAQTAQSAQTAVTADTAAPTGAAGGALDGSYPDPEFAKDVVPLTLTTGWTTEPGFAEPAVWMDAYGVVHFIGGIERTSGTATSPFALPPEFRPTHSKNMLMTAQGGVGYLGVAPNGTTTVGGFGGDAYGFLNIEEGTYEADT
jgi:hypothetical protein